jgi:hypothetical protein
MTLRTAELDIVQSLSLVPFVSSDRGRDEIPVPFELSRSRAARLRWVRREPLKLKTTTAAPKETPGTWQQSRIPLSLERCAVNAIRAV